MRKIIVLVLAAVLLLTGCSFAESVLQSSAFAVHYSDMEYQRPDIPFLRQLLSEACEAAQGEELEQTIDAIYAFYDAYDLFYTNYSLADIRYSGDLTDIYWEEERNFCAENAPAVDAALEELYYALAQSPLRPQLEAEEYFGPGYFEAYDGDNLWDDHFTALMEEESALVSRYYDLSEESLAHGDDYDAFAGPMIDLLAELIRIRQEQAAYWGYDDYSDFAWDFYYDRDYTTAQAAGYLEDIRRELVPLYAETDFGSLWEETDDYWYEDATFDYVRTAAKNMGGTVKDAFRLMDTAGLYDIEYGENKYNSSFEVYLTSYFEPFVFMNPTLTAYDCLTFAHEFGHFCNDYASFGSYAGIDVTEVFSQGMEYLSLCYGEDTEELTRMKMADTLILFAEQAAFADFERRAYQLPGDALTAENLTALYDEVAREYGFPAENYDPREFAAITHFYTNPLYVISYVVSADTALQLYQLELENPGAGLACFEANLATECYGLMEFLESAGLESPFDENRLPHIRQTLEAALK